MKTYCGRCKDVTVHFKTPFDVVERWFCAKCNTERLEFLMPKIDGKSEEERYGAALADIEQIARMWPDELDEARVMLDDILVIARAAMEEE